MANSVNSVELRENLGDILNRVQYRNETIIVMRHGRPSAVLAPVNPVVSDPTVGLLSTAATPAAEPEKKSEEKPRKNPKKR